MFVKPINFVKFQLFKSEKFSIVEKVLKERALRSNNKIVISNQLETE